MEGPERRPPVIAFLGRHKSWWIPPLILIVVLVGLAVLASPDAGGQRFYPKF